MEKAVPSDEDESGEALLIALGARLMCFIGSTVFERLVRHRAKGLGENDLCCHSRSRSINHNRINPRPATRTLTF
jgi:hypothetical protein